MDNDLSLLWGLISATFSALFGVEIGIGFAALSGAFLSTRFCETKDTSKQIKHILVSVVLTCIIVDGTEKIYPHWIHLKVVALLWGFLVLLIAEKIYTVVRDTDATAKLGQVFDKFIENWTSIWKK